LADRGVGAARPVAASRNFHGSLGARSGRIGSRRGKGLHDLGWIEGRNVRFDTRWTGDDPARMRRLAAEIVALAPEVIMNGGLPTLVAMQQETRTIPIVFAQVLDPVGAGFVESLARPGGNITGFVSFEYTMAGKWLETLIAGHYSAGPFDGATEYSMAEACGALRAKWSLENIFEFLLVKPWKAESQSVAINAEKAHADGIAANWGTLSHQFATNQHRRANRPWSCPGEKIWIRVTDASHPLGREP